KLDVIANEVLVEANEVVEPFSSDFLVGFAITPETDFSYRLPFSPVGGTLEHDGTVTFGLVADPHTQITVGEFSIGFDPARVSSMASGFFVADTLPDNDLDILFDLSVPGMVEASELALTLAEADLLLAPELAVALGLPELTGADIGDARVDAISALGVDSMVLGVGVTPDQVSGLEPDPHPLVPTNSCPLMVGGQSFPELSSPVLV
ncbi:MAG TPA: hypothetical protein IGR64_11270, partial [Leptolyngbyaceae cyanobacterium M65_K2018_010]|nr:hypothetical protein [Leptolyngbyaceae cyanobacterium M65_K2018_010]